MSTLFQPCIVILNCNDPGSNPSVVYSFYSARVQFFV